jgi:large subunit ribosomal protein L17
MRHGFRGRKLGRTSAHREALFRNQLQSLVDKERIITTLPKAKELRPIAERVITRGKSDTLHARRWVLRWVLKRELVKKIFDDISPRFAERPGGYLRIVKLGPRQGDGAEMAVLEMVDRVETAGDSKSADRKSAKAAKSAKQRRAGGKPASKAAASLGGKSAKKVAEDAAEAATEEEIGAKEKPVKSKRTAKPGKTGGPGPGSEAAKKEGHKGPRDPKKPSTPKSGKHKPTRQKTG